MTTTKLRPSASQIRATNVLTARDEMDWCELTEPTFAVFRELESNSINLDYALAAYRAQKPSGRPA